MTTTKKKILLKVSGELFSTAGSINSHLARQVAQQIKELSHDHWFGIVIGGGNLFRGKQADDSLMLKRTAADSVGMLATVMNGILLHEIFLQEGLNTSLLSALHMPDLIKTFSFDRLREAQRNDSVVLFVGGLANPFFSTDTAAVVRALQCDATELWKATKVDYLYDNDPHLVVNAQPILHARYTEVLEKKLGVMDLTAIALAQENQVTLRIFNLFTTNSLLNVAGNPHYGSRIT